MASFNELTEMADDLTEEQPMPHPLAYLTTSGSGNANSGDQGIASSNLRAEARGGREEENEVAMETEGSVEGAAVVAGTSKSCGVCGITFKTTVETVSHNCVHYLRGVVLEKSMIARQRYKRT